MRDVALGEDNERENRVRRKAEIKEHQQEQCCDQTCGSDEAIKLESGGSLLVGRSSAVISDGGM